MADVTEAEIRLTANIFFIFLVDSMKNKATQFERCKEKTLTQAHIYYDLCILSQEAYTDLGEYDELLSDGKPKQQYINSASKFRNAELIIGKSRYVPFNSDGLVLCFNNQMKNNYQSVYHKAVQFARRYFDDNASPRNIVLIQKILYYILNDDSIGDDQEFYISSDGSPITKSKLKELSEIEFEAFILGIWHYLIISQRLKANINSVTTIVGKLLEKSYDIQLVFKKEVDITDSSNNANDNDESSSNNVKKNASKYSGSETILPPDDSDLYPMELDRDNIISVLEKNDIRLSRAIFFYLLTNNIQTIHPKRNKNVIEKLFIDLLNLTVDNNCSIDFNEIDVRKEYNKFKYLKNESGADCLDNATEINAFTDKLYSNYDEVLSDMIKIRKKYFNSDNSNEALVVELVEFIKNDKNIDDNQEFFVCSDGFTLTKAELCEAEKIEFEPFLLGIWHYVISQLDSVDSADEYTFDKVFRVRYKSNGTDHTIYRTGGIISEQSELYVELTYLED